MLYGNLYDQTLIVTDATTGKQIVETKAPSVPDGYVANSRWDEMPDQIVQVWALKPADGTQEDAAVQLAKLMAKGADDDVALQVPALFDEWLTGISYYTGDRVRYQGVLYKCLQDHVSQSDWTPTSAPSLWAKVLPGQAGNEPADDSYAEWVQPDSTNGYSTGDKVTYNGRLWESEQNNNVWRPGDVGAPWKDLGTYPQE